MFIIRRTTNGSVSKAIVNFPANEFFLMMPNTCIEKNNYVNIF